MWFIATTLTNSFEIQAACVPNRGAVIRGVVSEEEHASKV
jgi:hypothetical protein